MGGKVWVCDDEGSTRFPVFTRGNVGEVFSEAVSPLTWSAYGRHAWEPGWRDAFCEIGLFTADEFKPAGQCEIVACFGGYVYINMSVTRVLAVRIPGLSVDAIDKSFFGDSPGVPPYRPDPRDENSERAAQARIWLASLFAIDPKPLADQDRDAVDALLKLRPNFGAMSDGQLLDYFRSLRARARSTFKRHLINTYGANVLVSVIAQIAQAAGAGDLAAKVTAGVGDVDSALQSFELWKLSRNVRSSAVLADAFERGIAGLLDRLRASDDRAARGFLAQWDAFIDRWGCIGPNVWEFRSPTYRSNPEIALQMLDRARRAPEASSPGARTAMLIADREAATSEIAGRVANNAEVHSQFTAAARSAGNYSAARERSKMSCTLLVDEACSAMRELGQRLASDHP